ncbi:MAG: 1-(5-phosphoribosyl)-5-[(5-phosphoribosylamino)methylideneamino] imidazole-4-carboxamide isomerase [Rhodobacteraceae bacterium]|nr:1-(5-phosphoribosyl)-5-[(5-phosphoribosylamino)methylideneamino] imidazole-4-carboxamide isomerase [Paracoccaceae bacterium]
MIIYPVLQILDGKCVSLERGEVSKPIIWHFDPVEKAKEFAQSGASWIHVTDIDSLLDNESNEELILEIIRQTGVPIQVGGGIRSVAQADHWFELGVGRVIFGTLAVTSPFIVKEVAKLNPDQVVISLDIWQGKVMIHGWRDSGAIDPADFIFAYNNIPLAGIVITDVDSSVDELESTLEQLTELAEIATSPVIASGVVQKQSDIDRLREIYNVQGVLVGQAIYNRRIEIDGLFNE